MPRYFIERKAPGDETIYSPTGEVFDSDAAGLSAQQYLAECETRDGWTLRAIPEGGGEPVTS